MPKGDYIYLCSSAPFVIISDYKDSNRPDGVKSWDGVLEYSTDGESWDVWSGGEIISDKFYFRGEGNTKITGDECQWKIKSSEYVYCSGDIVNLLNYKTKSAENIAPYCFANMFYNNANLVSAPELSLSQISKGCYKCMFSGCTKLEKAVSLPAKKTAESCYERMFEKCPITDAPRMGLDGNLPLEKKCFDLMFANCKQLRNAPVLSFNKVAEYCYAGMFSGCESLKRPMALPATVLAEGCYMDMFKGCKSLVVMPDLPATDMAKQCYQSMFFECTSIKNMSDIKAKKLADSCFMGMFKNCVNLEQVFDFDKDAILCENCFNGMFAGCTKLKFSESKDDIYKNNFYIPTPPALEWEEYMTGFALEKMFEFTGGDFTDDPEAGQTYYTQNRVK